MPSCTEAADVLCRCFHVDVWDRCTDVLKLSWPTDDSHTKVKVIGSEPIIISPWIRSLRKGKGLVSYGRALTLDCKRFGFKSHLVPFISLASQC